MRLSPEDHGNARGLDLDESVQIARWLAEDGVDFLHRSPWGAPPSPTPTGRVADPAWEPTRPPLAPEELEARGLSPVFVDDMRRWRDFVRG